METVDIERGLLGALILDPRAIDLVAPEISGDDFADPGFGQFYEAMCVAREAGIPLADPKVLATELKIQGVPDCVSGIGFVARLATEGVASNATHYAKLIKRGAILRYEKGVAIELAAKVDDCASDPEEIAHWLSARIAMIHQSETNRARLAVDIANEILEDLKKPRKEKSALMFGIPALDEQVGGWMPGELIVLAARTSMGKTALAMQVASYTASRGRGVLFVSLEMKDRELISRLLCSNADVDSKLLRTGGTGLAEFGRLETARDNIANDPLLVLDPPRATVEKIRAMAKREAAHRPLRLIVVDYLQIAEATDKRVKRHEQVSHISRELKSLAKELDVPILALSQLNRESTKFERPQLHHLAESGSLEQDADAVLFIYRESKSATDAELIVAKHRHAPTGKIKLEWNGTTMRFDDHNEFPGYSGSH